MKYALTYRLSLEDVLQVENQRERQRDCYSSKGGVWHSFIYSPSSGEGVGVFAREKNVNLTDLTLFCANFCILPSCGVEQR